MLSTFAIFMSRNALMIRVRLLPAGCSFHLFVLAYLAIQKLPVNRRGLLFPSVRSCLLGSPRHATTFKLQLSLS